MPEDDGRRLNGEGGDSEGGGTQRGGQYQGRGPGEQRTCRKEGARIGASRAEKEPGLSLSLCVPRQ